MKFEDLVDAYYITRKNKRNSPEQVEFDMHWEGNLLKILEEVNNRTYKQSAYTFIVVDPKPREVFASDTGTRVLHHYLDIRLRPLLEKRLTDRTYNNRVGKGTSACQQKVREDIFNATEGYKKDAWIIKLDISSCFPNIRQDIAYKQLLKVIEEDYFGEDKEDLIYLLGVCLFFSPDKDGCERRCSEDKWKIIPPEKSIFNKPQGIGAMIGHLIWQNAVNYYFNEIDKYALTITPYYNRFTDDMFFIVKDKQSFLKNVIPELRRRLEPLGAKLNEKKFYCQHYSKGCECLGVHIKFDRVYVNKRVIRRGKEKARSFNHNICEDKIDDLLASMNSYLGLCKNANSYKQALNIVNCLSPLWEQFVHFDSSRCCLVANEGFTKRERIIRKFNLKQNNERLRNSRGNSTPRGNNPRKYR